MWGFLKILRKSSKRERKESPYPTSLVGLKKTVRKERRMNTTLHGNLGLPVFCLETPFLGPTSTILTVNHVIEYIKRLHIKSRPLILLTFLDVCKKIIDHWIIKSGFRWTHSVKSEPSSLFRRPIKAMRLDLASWFIMDLDDIRLQKSIVFIVLWDLPFEEFYSCKRSFRNVCWLGRVRVGVYVFQSPMPEKKRQCRNHS